MQRTGSPRRSGAAGGAATLRPVRPALPRNAPGTGLSWRDAIAATVDGLAYELVDIERVSSGLLRVTIDRMPGREYASGPGEFVTVEDCEQVTRQLQYALEVDDVAYSRLEVSSPGLDRPLRKEADFERFAGHDVSVTLKLPFQGRKVWKGELGRAADGVGWSLALAPAKAVAGPGARRAGSASKAANVAKAAPAAGEPEQQVLGFTLDEVREARLVPVVDFKGRRSSDGGAMDAAAAGSADDAAANGVDGG